MTTITIDRAVVEQALEALLKSHTCPLLPDDCEEPIAALRAALAQPVQQTERGALRADAERWQFIESRMSHQHRGDACGWTLDELLAGDDPDAAIDAAREES